MVGWNEKRGCTTTSSRPTKRGKGRKLEVELSGMWMVCLAFLMAVTITTLCLFNKSGILYCNLFDPRTNIFFIFFPKKQSIKSTKDRSKPMSYVMCVRV